MVIVAHICSLLVDMGIMGPEVDLFWDDTFSCMYASDFLQQLHMYHIVVCSFGEEVIKSRAQTGPYGQEHTLW